MKKQLLGLFFLLKCFCGFAQPGSSFYIDTAVGSASMRFSNSSIYTYTNQSHLMKSDFEGNVSWTKTLNNGVWTADENSIYCINIQNILNRIDTLGNLVWSITMPSGFCYGNVWRIISNHDK